MLGEAYAKLTADEYAALSAHEDSELEDGAESD